jgi:hypothetical protein
MLMGYLVICGLPRGLTGELWGVFCFLKFGWIEARAKARAKAKAKARAEATAGLSAAAQRRAFGRDDRF